MIGVVAVVAVAVFAPWAYRNLVVLGSPLPGQAVTNALYLSGFDIFAWNDPPTLARHLAIGPAALIELRIAGLTHNLFNVLVFLGIPVSVIGLVALPWHGRGLTLRPLLWISLIMFFVTSLLFPAATQWGTFLHAAAPVHVLIVISAAARPRCRHRPVGAPHGLDQPDRLARDGRRAWFLAPLLRRPAADVRRRVARHAGPVRGAWGPDGGDRATARSNGGSGDHQLPDLDGGGAAHPIAGAARRAA